LTFLVIWFESALRLNRGKGQPVNLRADQEAELAQSLVHDFYAKTKHYAGWQFYNTVGPVHFETEEGRGELQRQVSGRLEWFRATHIPWLLSQMKLDGARILEVGAGTGVSTVALLEAGAAYVHGIDVDDAALTVARKRVSLHGFKDAEFHAMNATDLEHFSGQTFDLILFFATIEHMTHLERMATLPLVWNSLMGPGALLCVLDTPNRLWYNDRHTGMLPFFHWLPDDVAIDYMRFSPRNSLRDDFVKRGPDDYERLARWGRGISFHDFDLWFGQIDDTTEVVGMDEYYREKDPAWAKVWEQTLEGRFYTYLREAAPHVPSPFFGEALNLVIRKPRASPAGI
jgi:S-adenosylmethionine-dependent methyltransferase